MSGAKAYIDPFTTSGRIIIDEGEYEPGFVELLTANLPRGGCFVDVGANEGLFSGIAAHLLGDGGHVIAVEPQSRLRDILEIHLALNSRGTFRIYQSAISERDGSTLNINLGPMSHSGGSSLVRPYRWNKQTEEITTRTIDGILSEAGARTVDLMKVDVEGFEPEVVRSAATSLASKRISVLAIDYHGSILAGRGIDPKRIDDEIRGHGYTRDQGNPEGGYCVYHA